MTGVTKHEDMPLEQVPVYQGPQAKAKQFYVPLSVFAVECILGLFFFRLFEFWTLLFILPVHLLLMMKTAVNQWWVENLICNIQKKYFASNRGIRGKNVITFTPHTTRREIQKDIGKPRKIKKGQSSAE